MNDSLELDHTAPSRLSLLGERALLILVLATGIFFRAFHLTTVPTGVLYDEAHNGIDVHRILAGERPLFLPANYGREALFQYLQAASVGLFGHTDWTLRVPASACGTATLPLSYLLVRRLCGPRVALLTCAWLAISLWHVMYSRIGLRTIALPVALAAGFYGLWRGFDSVTSDAEIDQPVSGTKGWQALVWFGRASAIIVIVAVPSASGCD